MDLTPHAGIPATLEPSSLTVRFGPEILAPEPERRTSGDLKPVLYAPEAADPADLLYTVCRGVVPRDQAEEFRRRALVYVVTVLRGGTIGGAERVRTRGHTNSTAPGTSIAYPEVHEVWAGRALLYLQGEVDPTPDDVVTIAMEEGDKAVVAPGWAALMVNAGDEPLVLGTWRTADCVTEYDAVVARKGMAHFVLASAAPSGFALAPNPAYRSVPPPRAVEPRDLPDFGLKKDQPMLTSFHRNPDFLRFLARPQDYDHVWQSLYE